MMDQAELNRKLKQHQLWLETSGAEGKCVDLQNTNLQGAYLEWANLRRANFRGAYLEWAYLFRASLQDADLRGADLRGAYLEWANLRRANLRDADLQRARLMGVNLRGADLKGAKFDINIQDCWNFAQAKFTADALPWLILHPKWAEWKDSVQIEEV
jgi:uncharacterized protein YjbI with pentapeptide repeats